MRRTITLYNPHKQIIPCISMVGGDPPVWEHFIIKLFCHSKRSAYADLICDIITVKPRFRIKNRGFILLKSYLLWLYRKTYHQHRRKYFPYRQGINNFVSVSVQLHWHWPSKPALSLENHQHPCHMNALLFRIHASSAICAVARCNGFVWLTLSVHA